MRIAITSRLFFPSTGGVPVIVRLLANAWHDSGHEVRLLTGTANAGAESSDDRFPILRLPGWRDLWTTARWCDVLFQAEVSLKLLWPFVLRRRPCFVSHHTHFTDGSSPAWFRRAQGLATRLTHPISCSNVIRQSWGGRGAVIGNAYDDQLFRRGGPLESRPHELLFVGRLIRDKGIDVLLHALHLLKSEGLEPRLRIIGDEWHRSASLLPQWQSEANALGLANQVTFLGALSSAETAQMMQTARVLVVPSTWQEPFGIVALEGLAAGCRVVASSGGGLPEAGGAFVHYFPNGNVAELARALRASLLSPSDSDSMSNPSLAEHLAAHRPAMVAQRFIQQFEQVVEPSATPAITLA